MTKVGCCGFPQGKAPYFKAFEVVAFQCPPSFTPTPENQAHLRAFFHQAEIRRLNFPLFLHDIE